MAKAELDENLPAVKVMRKFGSNRTFALAIGRTPSTTARYIKSGYFMGYDISALMSDIVAAAKTAGIKLEPTDFVDLRLFPELA